MPLFGVATALPGLREAYPSAQWLANGATSISLALASLGAVVMAFDLPFRSKMASSGCWLWPVHDRIGGIDPALRPARALFGAYLPADVPNRRLCQLLVGLGWVMAIATLGLAWVWIAAVAVALPFAALFFLAVFSFQWFTILTERIRLRLEAGVFSMCVHGAWLPITQVVPEEDKDTLWLLCGPLGIRSYEIALPFSLRRRPTETARDMHSLCAPRERFELPDKSASREDSV